MYLHEITLKFQTNLLVLKLPICRFSSTYSQVMKISYIACSNHELEITPSTLINKYDKTKYIIVFQCIMKFVCVADDNVVTSKGWKKYTIR